MNIFGNIKEILNEGKKFTSEANAVSRFIDFLKWISLITVTVILLIQYWNVIEYIHIPVAPLFAMPVRLFLHKYSLPLLITLMIYYSFMRSLLRHVVIIVETKTMEKLLPL